MRAAARFATDQVQRQQCGERARRLQPTRFTERLMQHAKVMSPLEVGNFERGRRLPAESWLRTSIINHPCEKAEVKRLNLAN